MEPFTRLEGNKYLNNAWLYETSRADARPERQSLQQVACSS